MINSQRRLAIFLPGLYGGGAERIMLNLAQGLAGRDYAVDLVLARSEGPFLAQVPETVRLVKLDGRRTLTSLPALVRYLRIEQPEAMLSALSYANIITLWARHLAGVPERVVITEHNTFSRNNQHVPSWYSRLLLWLVRRFYPWADGIVAVSKGVADDLACVTGIPHERIKVIYNPVITPELRQKAQAPLDHPWFQPGQSPVVLAVGRLTAQKDFTTLIQAFAQVRGLRQIRLMILGEGEERPALEALVRKLDLEQAISLPGFVANPYPYIAHASVFALSSRWEGLPTALIEALYCHTFIVATDCPSGPREILVDGQYGQLVPVGDASALARAIEAVLAGKGSRPSPESWRPYEQEVVMNQYIDILLES